MRIVVFSFALISLYHLVTAAVTCYDPNGKPLTGAGWENYTNVVCDTTAAVSICCSPNDNCLSNGLCFNTGADNYLSFQGCTDPNWGAPCHKFCSGAVTLSFGAFIQ
jgi:hypothetical protein